MIAKWILVPGMLCLLLGPPAVAQERKKAERPVNPLEVIGQLDANNDKVIERDEVPESGRAAFDRLLKRGDSNENGKLDGEEVRALLTKLRALTPNAGGSERLRSMDKDDDGKVSRKEFLGPEAIFDRIDANRDGFITEPEARRAREKMAEPERTGANRPQPPTGDAPSRRPGQASEVRLQRLREMDSDGNGAISREEFKGPRPLFDRLDADDDGSITREEIRKAVGQPGREQSESGSRSRNDRSTSPSESDSDRGAPSR